MAETRVFRILARDYPYQLRELAHPPDPFCVRGELLAGPRVAIVGTRHASEQALHYTYELARALAFRGVTVWSGGALGIDAAAHRGALDAGGASVAVVATGLHHCYPPEHEQLYDELVAKGGALVSPFELESHATLRSFHERNGVLAALTQATVVVQAPVKSGARSTAKHARRLGRPLFVTPASPWDLQGEGNLLELRLGALLLTDQNVLFNLLGVPRVAAPAVARASASVVANAPSARSAQHASHANQGEPSSAPPAESPEGPGALVEEPSHLSPSCAAIFRATSATPKHLDDLCFLTGLSAALVQEALLTLTLEAVLVEGPAGRFRRATARKY